MKILEKILMLLAFITAIGSMITNIYLGNSWTWQFTTLCWVLVAYLKTKTIEKNEI